MLIGAVGLGSALYAAAAIAGAEVSERRGRAFAIFVALVADVPSFVAAMRVAWAVFTFLTRLETTVRQGVAREVVVAVGSGDTRNAAVAIRIAARRRVGRAVDVTRALRARVVRAVQSQ